MSKTVFRPAPPLKNFHFSSLFSSSRPVVDILQQVTHPPGIPSNSQGDILELLLAEDTQLLPQGLDTLGALQQDTLVLLRLGVTLGALQLDTQGQHLRVTLGPLPGRVTKEPLLLAVTLESQRRVDMGRREDMVEEDLSPVEFH